VRFSNSVWSLHQANSPFTLDQYLHVCLSRHEIAGL
jgi:hypothetical protein